MSTLIVVSVCAIVIIQLFTLVLIMSLCKAAKDADEQIERMWNEQQDVLLREHLQESETPKS